MTLLELVAAYQDLLKREGRTGADRFLVDVGADKAIRRAISSNFDDKGQSRRIK